MSLWPQIAKHKASKHQIMFFRRKEESVWLTLHFRNITHNYKCKHNLNIASNIWISKIDSLNT